MADRQNESEQNENEIVRSTEHTAPVKDAEKRLGVSMLTKIALAAVVICSLIISISCVMKANQLAEEAAELQEQIDDYNEKIARLQYYLNKEVDDEYIVEFAREYLNMHFPDEEIYYNDVNE